MKKLRLILGDQLNHKHSWYDEVDNDVTYCLFEMRQETDYVTHHIQKVVAFFAAMRAFAAHLTDEGHQVIYYQIDHEHNQQTLDGNLNHLINKLDTEILEYQLPDEYRLDQQMIAICDSLTISSQSYDTEHFLTARDDVATFFEGKKSFLMESFYRSMRKKYNILMDGDKPLTDKWNYDADNRKKLKAKQEVVAAKVFPTDVSPIHEAIQSAGIETIGRIDAEAFIWPVTRDKSLELLEFFATNCLELFGKFQDAMHVDHWSIYHCRLSFSINTKILHPMEVIDRVLQEWKNHQETIHISTVEGFIRQILGWREYMRGIYWMKMPSYASLNFFEYQRKLPSWYWTGKTKMNCLAHAIGQSLDYAYAHHIQRLMITGNFALLAGIDPDAVDSWYLGIYIDAIEWVEITNTRGMSQYADGGIVGSKPYVSSANYVNKMSNYCKGCHYNHKEKIGDKACPFNSLYWNFYDAHRDKLSKNARVSMMYRVWDKFPRDQQVAILQQADFHLKNIENL